MMYNVDCLVLNQDTLEKQINDVRLQYYYLERLVNLERRKRNERQIINIILSLNKKLRIKKRRIFKNILDNKSS